MEEGRGEEAFHYTKLGKVSPEKIVAWLAAQTRHKAIISSNSMDKYSGNLKILSSFISVPTQLYPGLEEKLNLSN